MRTVYTPEHGQFSDTAHLAAQCQIYPAFLGIESQYLTYESTMLYTTEQNTIMDGTLGIDRIVKAKSPNYRRPLEFTVQERFRDPKYLPARDITITEWNLDTRQPSELFKLKSMFFVYGYYDSDTDTFADALVIDVPKLMLGLVRDETSPKRRRTDEGDQRFIVISWDELEEMNAILWRKGTK